MNENHIMPKNKTEYFLLKDFISGTNLYPQAITEFCEVFNIDLFNDNHFEYTKNRNLERGRKIKSGFFTSFKNLRIEMEKYQKEKYSWKSILEIAAFQSLEVENVLDYLNSLDYNQKVGDRRNLDDGGKLTMNSTIKAISSYKIQNDIQALNRLKSLKSRIDKI